MNNSNSHPPDKKVSADDLLKKLKANAEKTSSTSAVQPESKSTDNKITDTKSVIPKVENSSGKDDLDIEELLKRYAPDSLPIEDEEEETPEPEADEDEDEELLSSKNRTDEEKPDIGKKIKAAEQYAIKMAKKKSKDDSNTKEKEKEKSEEEKKKAELDDVDVNLMIAFGMDDELTETVGIEKVNEIEADISKTFDRISDKTIQTGELTKTEFEYTNTSQIKEILQNYKKVYHSVLIRFGACFLLLILSFFYENVGIFGGNLPIPVHPDVYPVVHILINLQFLVFASALIYKALYNGMIALFKLQPIPESVTFAIVLLTFIYHIVMCFINTGTGVRMFNFSIIACIFLTIIYEFMNLKREIYGFNITASKRMKYAVDQLSPNKTELESETFFEYLPPNPVMMRIKKSSFIEGFYKRMSAYPKNKKILTMIIPAVVVVALAFFVFAFFYEPDNELYISVQLAYMALIICTPFSVFITYSYPFYKASKNAYENDSAIIGEASLEEYSNASAISFDDKDVFPSFGVKMKSVKVYGSNRIDQVIYYASSLFGVLGGPLYDVFQVATVDLEHKEKVDLIEVADDGIEAMVGDIHVLVGRAAYLKRNEFVPINPEEDEQIESGGEVCVMYMVCDNEVAAKIYIQYLIDPDFEGILQQLYKAGMCVGIKTFDPNINDSMLSMRIRVNKYPVKVIRCRSLDDQIETEERTMSGIISKNSPKSLLQTFVLCDKVLQIIKINLVIKIFAMALSMVIMIVLLVLNMSNEINSFYITLYQLFWSVPMMIIARLVL